MTKVDTVLDKTPTVDQVLDKMREAREQADREKFKARICNKEYDEYLKEAEERDYAIRDAQLKRAIETVGKLGNPEEWEKPDSVEYVPMKPLVETINAYRAKTAHDLLLEAADTLQDRGKERDKPGGERSMYRAVQIFNAIHPESALTELQGWRFMQCLKLAREVQGGFKEDDYLDGIGYAALKAECAIMEQE